MIATGEKTTKEAERHELADRVLMRAQWLDKPERALLEQVLGQGVRASDVAVVAGCSPRTIQRRVVKLIKRLSHPEVVFVLRHEREWDRLTAGVGLAIWVRRWGMRETARHFQIGFHEVRMRVQMIRGILEAESVKRERKGGAGCGSVKPRASGA